LNKDYNNLFIELVSNCAKKLGKNFFAYDIYNQNETISSIKYYTDITIYTGHYFTSLKPQQDIIITKQFKDNF
jgi:hypothetical protein